VTYHNCGDWVESCTALAEDFNGNIRVIEWATLGHANAKVQPIRRPSPIGGEAVVAMESGVG
jgi:hypothetical protein